MLLAEHAHLELAGCFGEFAKSRVVPIGLQAVAVQLLAVIEVPKDGGPNFLAETTDFLDQLVASQLVQEAPVGIHEPNVSAFARFALLLLVVRLTSFPGASW